MRRLALALLLALAVTGCGDARRERAQPPAATVDDGVADAQAARHASELVDPLPTKAALEAAPDAALARRLEAGAVAVVDLAGRMAIRPRALAFAKDGRLVHLVWTRWDVRGAQARGRLEGVVCQPDCGHGTRIEAPAVITLTRPVACPSGRFFDRSRIVVASDDPDARSTSWLAAPC
jgi:hypothetical protein